MSISKLPFKGVRDEYLVTRGGPPHDEDMEARVAALEAEMKYVRRDLDEVRTDMKAVVSRLGSIDSTLTGMTEKLDKFPTKLQLSLWAGGGMAVLLGVAAALISLLLTMTGHGDAAKAVDAVRGK